MEPLKLVSDTSMNYIQHPSKAMLVHKIFIQLTLSKQLKIKAMYRLYTVKLGLSLDRMIDHEGVSLEKGSHITVILPIILHYWTDFSCIFYKRSIDTLSFLVTCNLNSSNSISKLWSKTNRISSKSYIYFSISETNTYLNDPYHLQKLELLNGHLKHAGPPIRKVWQGNQNTSQAKRLLKKVSKSLSFS